MMLCGEGIELINLCKICNSSNFVDILSFEKTVFSDGNITDEQLIKEECKTCGTIRTKLKINLEEFYQKNYKPSRNTDTIALLNNESVNRSDFVYQWILDLVGNQNIIKFENVLEIGCGQGFLLERFSCKNRYGIEPSEQASLHAKKVANVRNIGYEKIEDNEKYDFVYSYCVIEHVEDPSSFLDKQYNILNGGGKMCIALPIQDKFNYDLFFADHIHHFSHKNFEKLLNQSGFSILKYELGRGSYTNIGMYICEKVKKNELSFKYIKNNNLNNIKIILNNIDEILKKYENETLYAFGYGEIAKTILPYTNLDNYIKNYIDDFSTDTKVISSKNAKYIFKNEETINLVLLVNPAHIKKIKSLFKDFNNINFINIFKDIEVD